MAAVQLSFSADALEDLRPTQARIDLDRLTANYERVSAEAGIPIMPVIKAGAYGHGARRVAAHFESLGAPLLAVAYAEEGAALRATGITVPLVVLSPFGAGQADLLLEYDLTPVLSTAATIDAAVSVARRAGRPLPVHLKVDTGMSRLGFPPAGFADIVQRALDRGGLELMGLMTHLGDADQDAASVKRQLDAFDDVLEGLDRRGIRARWVHAANSAGLCCLRSNHTLARPGLLLYGLRPRPLSPPIDVRPVMSLVTRIALVKEIEAGTRVSYGGRFEAKRRTRLATLPVGYADGVPRTAAMIEQGRVGVGGQRVAVAGAVCMDLMMADVTDRPSAAEGDEVVLFGDDPTAWDVGDWAGTHAWQILTAVGQRVPRVYLQGGQVVDVEHPYLA